jgi:hypothetical protein
MKTYKKTESIVYIKELPKLRKTVFLGPLKSKENRIFDPKTKVKVFLNFGRRR